MSRKWIVGLIGGIFVVLAVVLAFVGQRVYRRYQDVRRVNPPSEEWFFENSDIISYVEVLEVDKEVDKEIKRSSESLLLGSKTIFSKQHAKVRFLKILKGPGELENTTANIIKRKAYFGLGPKEKRVLYLRRGIWRYYTVSIFGGEWRLASVLANVNALNKDKGSGIVVGLLNKGDLQGLEIHVLHGRHKSPVILDSEVYEANFVKEEKIGEFDIAEISLEPGAYTLLIELDGSLYSGFSQLVDGHYPYVIIKEDNWRGLHFDMEGVLQ